MKRATRPWLLALLLAGANSAGAAPRSPGAAPPDAAAPREARSRGPSTVAPELQRAAERLLRAAKPVEGAVVLLEPKSGRVISFAALSNGRSSYETLTRARLPAASLFKLVTATALLETTALSPRSEVCINGGMHGIERRHLEPARGPGTQCGPFAWALGHSRNAVFAQLATRLLTRDDLLKTAERLGFNSQLSIDAGEQRAELGKLDVPYGDLEFARAAAGFQGSSLSPLGAAYLMTLVARGGAPIDLRLHDDPAGAAQSLPAVTTDPPSPPFSPRTAQRLTRMLEVTVETGTSRAAFTAPDGKRYLPGIRVAGKTGTLRPGGTGQRDDTMTSWFAGFAPSRNPEIVVSVMLVNGRIYRRKANELARDLLRTYFRSQGYARTVTDPFAESTPDALANAASR